MFPKTSQLGTMNTNFTLERVLKKDIQNRQKMRSKQWHQQGAELGNITAIFIIELS
jgi:hypothetical protein